MNKIRIAVFTALLLMPLQARAQTTVVLQPSYNFNDQVSVETVLREKRVGSNVTSAQVDICLADYSGGKWDRVVIDLKPEGNTLKGSGISQNNKSPITFQYTFEHKGEDLNLSGTLTVGGKSVPFKQERISEQTEKEYKENLYELAIVDAPADFSAVSPQWVIVKVKRGKLASVFDRLRKESVQVDSQFGLVEDCAVLRADYHIVQFATAPERARSFVPELRKMDGVIGAGWGNFLSYMYAVRLPGDAWSSGGKPDRRKLQAALEKSVLRVVGGKLDSATWDPVTGDLVVQSKRPSVKYPKLGLTELVEVRLLAEYEKLDSSQNLIVWVLTAGAKLADVGPGPRLQFKLISEIGAEGIYLEQDTISSAIARDLKGVTYDMENEKWR